MALNSLDIQNKTFSQQMRGYNKKEVDDFLDIIIKDYDEFAQKIKDLDLESKTLKERVEYFEGMKDSLNRSIVVAQDAADNLKGQAQSEASAVVSEAQQQAQAILKSAKQESGKFLNAASDDARRLVRETGELKRKMRIYHQRMISMIESQLEDIKSPEWDDIFKSFEPYVETGEDKLKTIVEEHTGKTEQLEGLSEALQVETTQSQVESGSKHDQVAEPAPISVDQAVEASPVQEGLEQVSQVTSDAVAIPPAQDNQVIDPEAAINAALNPEDSDNKSKVALTGKVNFLSE